MVKTRAHRQAKEEEMKEVAMKEAALEVGTEIEEITAEEDMVAEIEETTVEVAAEDKTSPYSLRRIE